MIIRVYIVVIECRRHEKIKLMVEKVRVLVVGVFNVTPSTTPE